MMKKKWSKNKKTLLKKKNIQGRSKHEDNGINSTRTTIYSVEEERRTKFGLAPNINRERRTSKKKNVNQYQLVMEREEGQGRNDMKG